MEPHNPSTVPWWWPRCQGCQKPLETDKRGRISILDHLKSVSSADGKLRLFWTCLPEGRWTVFYG